MKSLLAKILDQNLSKAEVLVAEKWVHYKLTLAVWCNPLAKCELANFEACRTTFHSYFIIHLRLIKICWHFPRQSMTKKPPLISQKHNLDNCIWLNVFKDTSHLKQKHYVKVVLLSNSRECMFFATLFNTVGTKPVQWHESCTYLKMYNVNRVTFY